MRLPDGANGRFYHIFFTAADVFGNSCSGEVLGSVPLHRGETGAAIDAEALFDSTLIPLRHTVLEKHKIT